MNIFDDSYDREFKKVIEFLQSPYTGDLLDVIQAENLISSLVHHGYDLNKLNLGDVKIKEKDGLLLLKYNGNKTFENTWNMYEGVSRGLILSKYIGTIVARGLPKFFNYGQTINEKVIAPQNLQYVLEKMDGTYIQLYYTDKWQVSGNGNFDNDFTDEVLELINNNYSFTSDIKFNDITYIFEYICPKSKIVINYGNVNDLYLLAIRNNFTGLFLPQEKVIEYAKLYKFKLPKRFALNNYEECLNYFNSIEEVTEGFVAYSEDFTQMVKIKSAEYVRLHGLQKGISKQKLVVNYKMSCFGESYKENEEEFYPYIDFVRQEIAKHCEKIYNTSLLLYDKMLNGNKNISRKQFTENIKANPLAKKYQSYLYLLYDRRSKEQIYQAIVKVDEKILTQQILSFDEFMQKEKNETPV